MLSRDIEPVTLSVVMPCLNEKETLATCIAKAKAGLNRLRVSSEIVVADNGSDDGSPQLAAGLGARVICVEKKGYGNALRAGIEAARGQFIIVGDSDDSYDFSAIGPLFEKLREGSDLVMGNRFTGEIVPGAMPWKHRWIGNPVLSAIGRMFFRSPVGDFHCGMRGFPKEAYARMNLQTAGMEFASEMVIRATLLKMRIAETPIVLYKDGRGRPPHLRSWRDGWRHLRFMLLFSPVWLFLIPGSFLFAAGLAGSIWLATGFRTFGSIELDVHSLLTMSSLCIVGYQIGAFALFSEKYATSEGLRPRSAGLDRIGRFCSMEGGIVLGLILAIAGAALFSSVWLDWRDVGFGHLAVRATMRRAVPATLLMAIGVQTIFTSFLLGILNLKNRD